MHIDFNSGVAHLEKELCSKGVIKIWIVLFPGKGMKGLRRGISPEIFELNARRVLKEKLGYVLAVHPGDMMRIPIGIFHGVSTFIPQEGISVQSYTTFLLKEELVKAVL
jgi:hypothetical protein